MAESISFKEAQETPNPNTDKPPNPERSQEGGGGGGGNLRIGVGGRTKQNLFKSQTTLETQCIPACGPHGHLHSGGGKGSRLLQSVSIVNSSNDQNLVTVCARVAGASE